jgi:hypothetical protein
LRRRELTERNRFGTTAQKISQQEIVRATIIARHVTNTTTLLKTMRGDMARVPSRRANTYCVTAVLNYDLGELGMFHFSFALNVTAQCFSLA